jgi:hypothetical protein
VAQRETRPCWLRDRRWRLEPRPRNLAGVARSHSLATEAEELLRELAFVYHATRRVKRALAETGVGVERT